MKVMKEVNLQDGRWKACFQWKLRLISKGFLFISTLIFELCNEINHCFVSAPPFLSRSVKSITTQFFVMLCITKVWSLTKMSESTSETLKQEALIVVEDVVFTVNPPSQIIQWVMLYDLVIIAFVPTPPISSLITPLVFLLNPPLIKKEDNNKNKSFGTFYKSLLQPSRASSSSWKPVSPWLNSGIKQMNNSYD